MNSNWLILVTSLPGRSGTPRMRIWRALKASGAGILRDGVYVLPQTLEHRAIFEQQASAVRELQGTAYILQHSSAMGEGDDAQFELLFDRSSEYAAWNDRASTLKKEFTEMDEPKARREEAQLRRELESITQIDFFPDVAQNNAQKAMDDVSASLNRHFSPDEPSASTGVIEIKTRSEFRNKTWATRVNLWVDRVASVWLIKRHIDPKAKFLWLKRPKDCPSEAIGFDFDGATFSHVDEFVTFEVLIRSFELETDVALSKIGDLVHFLDVGGVSVAECAGFVAMLSGAKHQSNDDDAFVKRAFVLLDNLYAAYTLSGRGE